MSAILPTGGEAMAMAAQLALWLAVGLAIGAVHFLSLRWNADLLMTGSSAVLPLVVQLARLALIAAALAVIALAFGALPLTIATAGIVAARTAVLRYDARS